MDLLTLLKGKIENQTTLELHTIAIAALFTLMLQKLISLYLLEFTYLIHDKNTIQGFRREKMLIYVSQQECLSEFSEIFLNGKNWHGQKAHLNL